MIKTPSYDVYILCSYELDALLEALRRDMRAQTNLGYENAHYKDLYHLNARTSKRLLEALNPKSVTQNHPSVRPKSPAIGIKRYQPMLRSLNTDVA
jgi:hypothetical protein